MTDVHFLGPLGFRSMVGKRALGLANLYVVGRKDYFDAGTLVGMAVADALQWDADAFVMTGDVTALAQDAEFEAALEAFSPLLERLPSVVIPGNHDVYTIQSARSARMERWMGRWMSGGRWDDAQSAWVDPAVVVGEAVPWPVSFAFGDTCFVATNPCRPTLRSTGRFGSKAINQAEALVRQARSRGQQVVYLLHYPVFYPDGSVYRRSGHDLEDIDALLDSFDRAPPDLVLHGHKHEAYRNQWRTGQGEVVEVINCGTTSAKSPIVRRTAGYFVYELEGGVLRSVRRRILPVGAQAFEDDTSFVI